jgi:MarR family transcriptional regulator, organic hydroperoxide resistance regulator
MDEAKLNEIILLLMENDSLNNTVFKRAFQKASGKLKNLSKNQPMVIKIIGMEGEVMPSTIGKYTGMNKSSLTHLIDDLGNKEIVYRKNDPEDRRKVLVSLTSKGLKCYSHLNKITAEMADELLEYISEEELDDLRKSLRTMIQVLKKLEASGKV